MSRTQGASSLGEYSYGNNDNDVYLPPTSLETRRESPDEEDEPASPVRQRRRMKAFALVAGCALLVGGLGTGGAIVIPKALDSAFSAGAEETAAPSKQFNSSREPAPVEVSIPSLPVDGWTRDSRTKISLREGAGPVTMTNGLVASITTDSYLYVVDPTTGEPVFGSSVADAKGVVTYKSSDGDDSVAWRSGSDVYTWDQKHGEQRYPFTEESRLYSSGSSPVVWERGDSSAHIIQPGGDMVRVSIPDGTVPVGVVGGSELISASSKNPVWISDVSSADADKSRHINLEAPRKGMQIRKWVGLSNGNIVVIWSSSGEMAASSEVNLTVHSVEDGSVIATQAMAWGSVEEANMVPDQTRTKFALGHVAFDGEAFIEADDKNVRITSLAGDRLYAINGSQAGEVKSGKWTALPEGTVTPLGIGKDGEAIVKVNGTAYALIQEGK